MEVDKESTIDLFKKDFEKIKDKWIPSSRFHDTGIGKTFEDSIGVLENNKPLADYREEIEIKSSRELSESMITLFTKSPEPKGVNTKIKERFGYYDDKHPDKKVIHTTFSTKKFNNLKGRFGFKLLMNDKKERADILVKNLETNELEDIEIFCPYDIIKQKANKKCRNIAFIKTESKKENGKEFFRFRDATLLTGLSPDKFMDFLREGVIKYDVRIGVFKSGKKKGKPHDHGSGFRLNKGDIDIVFSREEIS